MEGCKKPWRIELTDAALAPLPEEFVRLVENQYRLKRELGRGGMATVYLADDLKHGREVAIKVLSPHLAAALEGGRFLREIEIAARLTHPHVVALFDSGGQGDFFYYVMPYIRGETLRALLVREGQLPVEDALRLGREIASALGHAHQHGIVHRDIKPENILLSDGIAVVADFGICRAMSAAGAQDGALTQTGLLLGTPRYMSPEQAAGEELDCRSDIYSLACVLYELLAGRPPFVAPRTEALIGMHLAVAPIPLHELRPSVSVDVSAVIAKALAKSPDDRYATAARFAEALAASAVARPLAPPGTRRSPRVPNNLPTPRTRFIGKEKEIAECSELLGETRLLTLTGIGGCGKTRLALSIAQGLVEEFPDGVWFVDLAPLGDSARVPGAVAAVLGLSEVPGTDLLQTLSEHVRDKRLLLVLDNCEHVLSACADIADRLLRFGADMRIVATSREGLGIEGERLIALKSLSVPAKEELGDLDALKSTESVRLFVDRVQTATNGFIISEGNAAAIAEICRRLDGIPLAIELAAARMRLLSVEQIRSKLDDRFRLLAGGSRTAVPRHQTLSAAIQWSYDQLSDEERHLFRLLSVFAGGWTLDSATKVVGEGADEFAVLETLGHLSDKSLILVQRNAERAETELRYGMLETVRQYARERLDEAGELDTSRQRHFDVHAALAGRAYAARLADEDRWAPVLEAEHDNLRAALEFVREAPERYLELAGALAWFWQARSHIIEGCEKVSAALTTSPPADRPARARALWGLGMMTGWQGDSPKARKLTEDALAMWRRLGDTAEIAATLEGIGWTQVLDGDDEAAEKTFEECLRLQREEGNAVLVNRAMVGLAQARVALFKVSEARPMASEIIQFSKGRNDLRNEHFGWHFLADCALIEDNCHDSLQLYRKSLELAQKMADRMETSFELQGVGMSLAGMGHAERGLRLIAAAKAEWRRIGVDPHMRFWDVLLERYVTKAREAVNRDDADRAWQEGSRLSLDDAVEMARSDASSAESE